MRITDGQIRVLDSLVVERLRDNREINALLVKNFENRINPTLVKVITSNYAFDKDKEGKAAYYVVKTPAGELLLYFSLKCGEMFEQLDMDKMQMALRIKNSVYKIQNREAFTDEEVKAASNFIQENLDEIKVILPDIESYLEKKDDFKADINTELNTEMQRVLRTYPAIEVVEFCANENGRAAWKSLGIQRKMGECVFWHWIVPKLKKVQDEVGCQYVYLFAADSSLDGNLANYYKVALHFEQSATLGANKPQYGFQCFFLCQELNKLLKHREAFYEYFNPDNTDWV